MSRARISTVVAPDHRGTICIGVGLAVVLAAQIWSAIPLATAIAVIGLGATLTLAERRQRQLLLHLNLLIYTALVSLAIAAQLHARVNVATLCDAASAVALLLFALKSTIIPRRT